MPVKYSQDVEYRKEVRDDDGQVIVAEGWAFTCSEPCGFDSSGWATKRAATTRAEQHQDEHVSADEVRRGEAKEPRIMPSIHDFIEENGSQVVMSEVRASSDKSIEELRPKGVR